MNDMAIGFVSRINALLQPEPPCEKYKCENYEKCKTEFLACKSFHTYVSYGRAKYPTEPNRELYLKIYGDDDIDGLTAD